MVEFAIGVVSGYLLGVYTASKSIRNKTNKALSKLWSLAKHVELKDPNETDTDKVKKTKKGGKENQSKAQNNSQSKPQGLDEDYW